MKNAPAPDPARDAADLRVAALQLPTGPGLRGPAPIIERLDALLAAALAELERRAPDSLPSHLVRDVATLAAARRSLTASQRPVAAAAAPTPAFVDNGPSSRPGWDSGVPRPVGASGSRGAAARGPAPVKFPPPMPFDEWNYHVANDDLNEAVQEYHCVWRATGNVPVWTPPGPAP